MDSVLEYMFDTVSFMPHGYCLIWRPDLVWMHGLSDTIIMIAYFSIPSAILYLLSRRRDLLHPRIAWLFVAFIMLCGITHGLALMTLWLPVYGAEGVAKALTALVSILTAITLWRIMPSVLAQPSSAEMIEAATRLAVQDQRSSELERSNAALESFALTAAHDLNAPLRALRIISRWIDRDIAKPETSVEEVRKHLSMMEGQVSRMERLIDGILTYAKLGGRAGAIGAVDIGTVVETAVTTLAVRDGLEIEVEGNLPTIKANENAISLVFRNLIDNAIKYHDKPTGKISVRFGGYRGNLAFFEIEDDGPGIPEAFRREVFSPFLKLESRDATEGAGLGLAIVERVIAAHGGTIGIEDGRNGRGTLFRFSFARDMDAASKRAQGLAPAKAASERRPRSAFPDRSD